ncbi:T9SS type A sorting domain-containing protein [Flavobacteriales bacterium]|nr:T9SS type A sorting domain-containing protein [Flavobacteriales bacterium]
MTVFPNPSTEVVNVNLPEEGKYILELFDLTGKRLFKETVRSSQYQFTVSDLAKGTYVLKVLNVSTMKVDSERLVVR